MVKSIWLVEVLAWNAQPKGLDIVHACKEVIINPRRWENLHGTDPPTSGICENGKEVEFLLVSAGRLMVPTLRAGVEPNQSHAANHLLSHHHLCCHNIDMGARDLFSRVKKKLKRRPHNPVADVNGENMDPANPLPPPHTVDGDGEGNEADTDEQQACSTDRPPQRDEPEPVPAGGRESNHSGGEADIDGREVGQTVSHLQPEVEVGAGSKPGGEGSEADGEDEQFYPCSPTPTGEPDGG